MSSVPKTSATRWLKLTVPLKSGRVSPTWNKIREARTAHREAKPAHIVRQWSWLPFTTLLAWCQWGIHLWGPQTSRQRGPASGAECEGLSWTDTSANSSGLGIRESPPKWVSLICDGKMTNPHMQRTFHQEPNQTLVTASREESDPRDLPDGSQGCPAAMGSAVRPREPRALGPDRQLSPRHARQVGGSAAFQGAPSNQAADTACGTRRVRRAYTIAARAPPSLPSSKCPPPAPTPLPSALLFFQDWKRQQRQQEQPKTLESKYYSRIVATRGWGRGSERFVGTELPFGKMEKCWTCGGTAWTHTMPGLCTEQRLRRQALYWVCFTTTTNIYM